MEKTIAGAQVCTGKPEAMQGINQMSVLAPS